MHHRLCENSEFPVIYFYIFVDYLTPVYRVSPSLSCSCWHDCGFVQHASLDLSVK